MTKMPTVIRCIPCGWVLGTNLHCESCEAERTAWINSRDYPFPLKADQQ